MTDAQVTAPKTRNVVMVGCKLATGLTIHLCEPGMSEASKEAILIPNVETRVTLAGANSSKVIGGFGITPVDQDFWNAWLKQNQKHPALKSGALFAYASRDKAMDHAVDHETVKTGFEGIDPDKPGRGIQRVPEKELREASAMG